MSSPKFGLGAPVRRNEDYALVTGHGRYVDDHTPAGCQRGYVVRAAIAHGGFAVLGVEAARKRPGVHLVWTHEDVTQIGTIPARMIGKRPDGESFWVPPRRALAYDKIRHVGEPIAFIVADTLAAARDAADALDIDYQAVPAVVEATDALKPDAPLVWEESGSNLALFHDVGKKDATDAAFAKADRVSRIEVVNNRLVANYMETRGIVAEYDGATERLTLTVGTQGGHSVRRTMGEVLNLDEARIRVITPDVGGGFGTKIFTYQEYPLVAAAAMELGRPVKWVADRTEHFLADAHGRDHRTVAEMAMDKDGRFLGLRVHSVVNIGAYVGQFGGWMPFSFALMVPGVYDIPAVYCRAEGAFTNCVHTEPYRGAGRPEAAYLIDRLVDQCGRETGLGPLEIRRRNFITPEKMPYETGTGRVYDTGEFAGHLARALEVADQAGFEARRKQSAAAGRLRGLGIASYIEACAFPGTEPATVTLNEDGTATLLIGTQTNGQGHATAYSQFVVGHLGLDYDKVTVIQGDTDIVKDGHGTGGSRSLALGAPSTEQAAVKLAGQIKELASAALEVAASDLELLDGQVQVVGTDRSIGLADLARETAHKNLLTATEGYHQQAPTFPNGTHIAEVEIDPETGATEILAYTVVDDFGVTVNPLLLEGQVHGGVAQGVGQALLERTVYDGEGQLLTASYLDYCMPRAADLTNLSFETRNVPSKSNAFGIKGAGEAGTVGACPAVMNAVVDALAGAGKSVAIDMPATPSRLWAALNADGG